MNQEVKKLVDFIKYLTENGCPPNSDCGNYKVDDKTNAVDCEMCLENALDKLLKQLGYLPVEEAHPEVPSDMREAT